FAACHVLHRLSVPRHPPNALTRLIRCASAAHREQTPRMPLQRLDLYSALHFTRLADAQDPLQLELPPKPGNPLPTASRIPIHNLKDQLSEDRSRKSEGISLGPAILS